MRRGWFLCFLIIMGIPLLSHAATRFASPGGSGTTCSTSNRCALQTALNQAVAGDTVIAGNGTYSGSYTLSANGSSGSKITLQAENRHQAFLVGSGMTHDDSNIGMNSNGAFWIIDGFDLSQYSVPVRINGSNVEIRNTLVHEFGQFGVQVYGQASFIHDNVVCCGGLPGASDYGFTSGIVLFDDTQNHTIQNNAVYSITDGKYVNNFGRMGYGIQGVQNNDNTLVENNVIMDANKATIRFTGQGAGICASTASVWTEGVTFRSNIMAYGQGGFVVGEELNSSTITNNLLYDLLVMTDNKGNDPGNDIFTHNTYIVGPHTNNALVFESDCFDPGSSSQNSTVLSNLLYSNFANTGIQFLHNELGAITSIDYNFYWRPGSTGTWGIALSGSNDFISTGTQPSFVNAAAGDYTLASGSPGKGTAHDSTDRGINFTPDRINIMKQILTLPTTENPTSGNSTSFTVDTSHYYQAFAYWPDSGGYTGAETWNVGGQSRSLDIQNDALSGGWVLQPPTHYIYIGTVKPSGTTLNVSWGTSSSTSKVLIRRMPTPSEAFTILQGAGGAPSFTFTTSSAVPLNESATLTYGPVSSSGTGLTCSPTIQTGQADAIWTGTTSAQLIAGTGSPKTGAARTVNAPTTYRMSCTDSNGTTTIDRTVAIAAPVLIYELNENFGTTVTDTSGNGLNGSIIGGTTWITGIDGFATSFNGVNQYIQRTDNALLDFTGDFTAALWVKTSQGAVLDTFPIIIAKSAGNTTGWFISLHLSTDNVLWYAALFVGGAEQEVHGTSNIADGNWHHLAVRRAGTTLTLFEAGVVGTTATVSGASLANAGDLFIGTWDQLASCCFYNGGVDRVRLYPYALTDQEVANLASGQAPDTVRPKAPTNLHVVTP